MFLSWAIFAADHGTADLEEPSAAKLLHPFSWEDLASKNLLVNQTSIIGRRGLCGATCIVNVLQGAAAASGQDPIENPQRLLEVFVKDAVKPNGGMTPLEVVNALKELQKKISPLKFDVEGVQMGIEVGPVSPSLIPISKFDANRLKPGPNELKLLITAFLKPSSKEVAFSHAQIIESYDGKNIVLRDPSDPKMRIIAPIQGKIPVNGIEVPYFSYGDTKVTYEEEGSLKSVSEFVPVAIITIKIPQDPRDQASSPLKKH